MQREAEETVSIVWANIPPKVGGPGYLVLLRRNCAAFVLAFARRYAERQNADLKTTRQHLGNILSRIHGDGGQYIEAHGWEQAVKDAITIVVTLWGLKADNASLTELLDHARGRIEALEAENRELREERNRLRRSLDVIGDQAKNAGEQMTDLIRWKITAEAGQAASRERVKELEEALTVAHPPCSCLAKVSAALRLPSSEPKP